MPPDLDPAFRKFIPPFGAAGNPVDITGGEPPKTYQNTIRLGLEDPRIHALILGYWHTIITPPMVFAKLVVEVVEEMKAKGIEKPIVASLAGDVEVEEAAEHLLRPRHPRLSLHDRNPGRGARREIPLGAWRRADQVTCLRRARVARGFFVRRNQNGALSPSRRRKPFLIPSGIVSSVRNRTNCPTHPRGSPRHERINRRQRGSRESVDPAHHRHHLHGADRQSAIRLDACSSIRCGREQMAGLPASRSPSASSSRWRPG